MIDPTHISELYQEEVYSIKPKVLVVLKNEWGEITDEERNLLDKILSSVKRSRPGVTIICRPSFSFPDIRAYEPSHVIAFGARLPDKNTLYEVIEDQGISLIQAESLGLLDDKSKKALWLGLRQMFGLKA